MSSLEQTITMRAACGCGSDSGSITERSGQDCVYCTGCGQWKYNAPRTETGRKKRSLASREGITPATRARILTRHDHTCIACGARPPDVHLTLEHIISREMADHHGMLDDLIDSEWNLAPMCEECNSGHRWIGHPQIRLMYRCLWMSRHVAETPTT